MARKRRTLRQTLGMSQEDPAGSEVGQEANEPYNSFVSRSSGSSRRRSRRPLSVSPGKVASGYGAKFKFKF